MRFIEGSLAFSLSYLLSTVRAAPSSGDEADVNTLYEGRIPFIVQTYPVGGGELQLSGW